MSHFTKRWIDALGVALLVIVDQASKLWVVRHLSMLDSLPLIHGWLQLVLVRNRGVVFGLASGGPLRPLFVLALPILLVPLIGWLLLTTQNRVERWAYTLILGGAIGNLIDRLRLGHVVDFIDAYYRQGPVERHWYTFNLADSFICTGAALLALSLLFPVKIKKPAASPELAPPVSN